MNLDPDFTMGPAEEEPATATRQERRTLATGTAATTFMGFLLWIIRSAFIFMLALGLSLFFHTLGFSTRLTNLDMTIALVIWFELGDISWRLCQHLKDPRSPSRTA